jgi:hypothetical protein
MATRSLVPETGGCMSFDEEFSCERDDHGGLARTAVGSRAVPLSECAIFLILQKPPRQFDHAAAHASVAGFCQTFLPPLAAALEPRPRSDRACDPRVVRCVS